jgi:hypothetical protein
MYTNYMPLKREMEAGIMKSHFLAASGMLKYIQLLQPYL